ncbi:MAG: peptidoglycan editing factor PgeF [Lachnospiraceae bacterium]|nr:peptidoglycan editing factor PgeF [Lachnospiraceae bacterium]
MTLIKNDIYPNLEYFTADNIHSDKITAIFTTRNGGASGKTAETEFLHSLNLQINSSDDDYQNIAENYRIIAGSQGFKAENVMKVHQIHTDEIIVVDSNISNKGLAQNQNSISNHLGEADALVTNIKDILLSVRVADCVPILLYDNANGAIAAIHAGWQGTFRQIGAKTVRRMGELYGTKPNQTRAAIGPAAGICCYEVDLDFYEKFQQKYGEKINRFFCIEKSKKPFCDLKKMNKAFLLEAGIPETNIEVSELCTIDNPGLFYSHRRNGVKRGTMAAFIGMK